ncbi:MAG TPA: Uma2 family endonuclease [Chloroflexota bacterium]|nr:Uma2 family endonuclease [Chloroflexota bacterium]
MAVVHKLLTPADFEEMANRGEFDQEGCWYELVDGEVICVPNPEWIHAQVIMLIGWALRAFAEQIRAVVMASGVGFIVGEHHQQVRDPDLSLITKQRRDELLVRGRRLVQHAPDLAVEVLSKEQHGEAYAKPKVAEYLAAGAKVVWLVDYEAKTVRAYEAGKAEYTVYSGDDAITLDAIAPGFSAPVSSFFPE